MSKRFYTNYLDLCEDCPSSGVLVYFNVFDKIYNKFVVTYNIPCYNGYMPFYTDDVFLIDIKCEHIRKFCYSEIYNHYLYIMKLRK